MPPFLKEYIRNVFTFATKATFVFFLVLTVVTIGLAQLFSQSQEITSPRYYRVEGMAERDVTPDVVNITVGSRVEGKNVVAIQEEANTKVNKAVAAIEALGIPKENIKTSSYNVDPVYDYEKNVIDTYRVNIEVRVKIEEATLEENKAGDVIKAASDNGLNEVRSLNYEVSTREDILEELKLEAIEDAKSKKDQVADAAGLRLGELKNIEDGYIAYPYYDDYVTYEYAPDSAGKTSRDGEAQDSININPGETELSVTITLVYEIL